MIKRIKRIGSWFLKKMKIKPYTPKDEELRRKAIEKDLREKDKLANKQKYKPNSDYEEWLEKKKKFNY